ncbi:MAG: NlpC/P60 family protein [Lachnospiraceae bacterium]|nr:NlpC/P60 family protein [Lachnospiraceae bacterium]
MNKRGVRIAACTIAGTMALSGYQMSLEAKIYNTANVPSAGFGAVVEQGSTIQDLQDDVIQNIAYLESASGLQHNIVLASEKAASAETLVSAVLVNPKTVQSKASAEVMQVILDEIGEVEAEVIPETSGQEETEQTDGSETEAESETDETETTQTIESLIDEIRESEESGQEEDDSARTSAGFSATDTYDDAELEEAVQEAVGEAVEEETVSEEETGLEEDEQDFSGLVIARVSNYVNVRSIPSEEGEIVGKLYDKSVGEFIEEENGWYKITSGNCTGYVKGEFCVVGEEAEALAKEVGTTYAIVNTTTLKVRQEPNTESAVLGLVPIDEELVVVEELDGWVKIAIEEGDGYVSRDYVSLRTDFVHAESKEEEEARLAKEAKAREEARAAAAATESARAAQQVTQSEANQEVIAAAQSTVAASEGSAMGKAVVDYATQFVGNPYVYGGSSLTNGTDCSGFVMSVYANFGVSLPHSSSAMRSLGTDVGGLQNAQPGDIVCYSGHVGLYIGNGQIVHASTAKTGIIVSNASYRTVLSVRRIF